MMRILFLGEVIFGGLAVGVGATIWWTITRRVRKYVPRKRTPRRRR